MDQLISAYLIKLRREHPFFATLSLYMRYEFDDRIRQFTTDGRTARLNPRYLSNLKASERVGTLLHLTLHCALNHPRRCGSRIAEIWNIAADIVVNQIIVESHFEAPPNTAIDPRYGDCSVEFVYSKLLSRARNMATQGVTAVDQGAESDSAATDCSRHQANQDQAVTDSTGSHNPSSAVDTLQVIYPGVSDLLVADGQQHPMSQAQQHQNSAYWERALRQALVVNRMSHQQQGFIPAGLERAIDEVLDPQLDWRTVLWRYMSRTPCDYSGFDRRFIHQGLYLDELQSESLNVHVVMDTSGSIGDDQLARFRAEVESIARCYHAIQGHLYFVDAQVYGPFALDASIRVGVAEGGGGTDFACFFSYLEKHCDPFEQALCIYLTDGYGTFPDKAPDIPVLWVATDDAVDHFPFGDVTRLN